MTGQSPHIAKAKAIETDLGNFLSGACYKIKSQDEGSKDYDYKIVVVTPDPMYYPQLSDRSIEAEVRLSYDKDHVISTIYLKCSGDKEKDLHFRRLADVLRRLNTRHPEIHLSVPFNEYGEIQEYAESEEVSSVRKSETKRAHLYEISQFPRREVIFGVTSKPVDESNVLSFLNDVYKSVGDDFSRYRDSLSCGFLNNGNGGFLVLSNPQISITVRGERTKKEIQELTMGKKVARLEDRVMADEKPVLKT